MATIETTALAQGLQQVENSWQAYLASQKRAQGLTGKQLSSALKACTRDYIRFQNQSQQFYAEVRKRVGDAEKLELDRVLYPHHFTDKH